MKNKQTNKSSGIKWPTDPIKALGVLKKLLHEKNFIERLDTIRELTDQDQDQDRMKPDISPLGHERLLIFSTLILILISFFVTSCLSA